MTRPGGFLTSSVAALVSIGCARSAARSATYTVDTTADTVHVVNTAPSTWTGTTGWHLVLERTIHPGAGAPEELIHPTALVASSTGELFILDRQPAVIKRFSADGHFLGTIGRQGSGPGEFGEYGVLYIVHDTLLVQDASQTRATVFAPDGHFVSSWLSVPIAATEMVADDSGRVPMEAPTGTHAINSGHLVVRYHADGRIADSVWYPAAPEPAVWHLKTAHADMGMVVPFTPDHVDAFDRAGRLISGEQNRYRLTYSSGGHHVDRLVDAPAAPVRIPDSLRTAEFTAATTRSAWLAGVAHLDDIPRDYPVWTAIVADGANNLWVLRPGPAGDGDHWDVFGADGHLLGAAEAPFHHADHTFWTRDHVYVLQDADDGTPAVMVYRIDRGGA
ncbi:MAG TPA: hypothetical protein VGM20_09210 [Gemmatimonadales bacterium]|jgi:hypothetical protein